MATKEMPEKIGNLTKAYIWYIHVSSLIPFLFFNSVFIHNVLTFSNKKTDHIRNIKQNPL